MPVYFMLMSPRDRKLYEGSGHTIVPTIINSANQVLSICADRANVSPDLVLGSYGQNSVQLIGNIN